MTIQANQASSRIVRRAAQLALAGAVVVAPMAVAGTANAASSHSQTKWDKVAQCESSGNWQANTGNGYYGGLQFSASTWKSFGGGQFAKRADQATKQEQIKVAERVEQKQGSGAWPNCG